MGKVFAVFYMVYKKGEDIKTLHTKDILAWRAGGTFIICRFHVF